MGNDNSVCNMVVHGASNSTLQNVIMTKITAALSNVVFMIGSQLKLQKEASILFNWIYH